MIEITRAVKIVTVFIMFKVVVIVIITVIKVVGIAIGVAVAVPEVSSLVQTRGRSRGEIGVGRLRIVEVSIVKIVKVI